MKIGIDARMFSTRFTGIGRCTYELTRRFFELRPDWEWVMWMNQPEYDEYDFPDNVKKVLVDAKHYSFSEQTKFLKMIRKEKCDLVHFMHFNVPFLYRRKYIATIHDLTLSYYPGYGTSKIKQWIYRAIMHNTAVTSKHLVAVSENTKNDLMKMHNIDKNKITTIYNGIDREDFFEVSNKNIEIVRRKFGIDGDYIFYAGNWKMHKNVGFLVRGFAKLREKFPHLKLVITGKKDGSSEDVEHVVNTLSVQDYVVMPGYVTSLELKALYKGSKAFVFPTLYEGFGLPALESMAMGIPVVTSDRSSLPEVCGDAALYFDPENLEDFVEKMVDFLENDEISGKLVEKGYEQVKKFSWDDAARDFLKLYEKVV